LFGLGENAVSAAEAAAWLSGIGTFLAAVVALFKEGLTRWWLRPRLDADVHPGRLGFEKTPVVLRDQSLNVLGCSEQYYFRLWVENKGRSRAERVQVYAFSLSRRQANGIFENVEGFLPMNLCWTHGRRPDGGPEVYADGLSPLMGRYCDIGHITEPSIRERLGESLDDIDAAKTIVALALEVVPTTKSHLLSPGTYRLELKLAAANCKPVTKTLEITHNGEWFSDYGKMAEKGLGVRLVT
jgi:hypothetical protein